MCAAAANREGGEQTDSLMRRLAADRKNAIEDFRALEARTELQLSAPPPPRRL